MISNVKEWCLRKFRTSSSISSRTSNEDDNDDVQSRPSHHHIVIIGGGLCGLHCATTLLETNTEHSRHSIAIREKKPYLGGRICTKRHDTYVMEYVAPNLETGKQSMLMSLLSKLNISSDSMDVSPFAPKPPDFASLSPDELVLFEKELSVNGKMPDVFMIFMFGVRKILDHNGIHLPWDPLTLFSVRW